MMVSISEKDWIWPAGPKEITGRLIRCVHIVGGSEFSPPWLFAIPVPVHGKDTYSIPGTSKHHHVILNCVVEFIVLKVASGKVSIHVGSACKDRLARRVPCNRRVSIKKNDQEDYHRLLAHDRRRPLHPGHSLVGRRRSCSRIPHGP